MRKNLRLILSLISFIIFLFILVIILNKTLLIDSLISQNIHFLWGSLNNFFIFLGNYLMYILIFLALISAAILYLNRRKKLSFILIFSLLVGYILEEIIKFVIQKERPLGQLVIEQGYGFPSGHSIFSIILFSLLIYFFKDEIKNKVLRILFISLNVFLILLTGFSRIYLNVHWFTDVIGGYALGFFIFNLILFAFKLLEKNKKTLKKI